MFKSLTQLAVIVLIIGVFATSYAGTVPSLVNYQGRLTDAKGNALSGTKTVECNIYDAATGGTAIWGPQIFTSVSVVNGMFNVILGEKDSSERSISDAFTSNARYLGIKVGDVEITPRQQILSTPFALKAEQSENAQSLNGKNANWYAQALPVGSIMAYWGSSAPEGWLLCNGDAIPTGNEYNALRALTGDKVPDLRGQFLRGLDLSGTVDPDGPGRTIGHQQNDLIKQHRHNFATRVEASGWGYSAPRTAGSNAVNGSWNTDDGIGLGYETRPKNTSVNFIIKY